LGVDLLAVWGVVEKTLPDIDKQIEDIIEKEEDGAGKL